MPVPSLLPHQPKHDYENWASIDSTRDKVQAEQGKPSPPPPTAKVGSIWRGYIGAHTSQCGHFDVHSLYCAVIN